MLPVQQNERGFLSGHMLIFFSKEIPVLYPRCLSLRIVSAAIGPMMLLQELVLPTFVLTMFSDVKVHPEMNIEQIN
jgi:hypothetical protein